MGFVVGYLAGCKDGQHGVKRLRASAEAVLSSDEVRRLTAAAISFAVAAMARAASGRRHTGLSGTLGTATDMLLRRASAQGKDPRAA